MKPTNLPDKNCTSTSSDCVIWDGPDISCISLCTGDSITRVVYLLAKKVCFLESQLILSSYNLTAMSAEFGTVTDFTQIIQNLITKAYAV